MHPVEIDTSGVAELRIAWQDGTESRISTGRLRRSCPCAACRSASGAGRIPLLGTGATIIREIILVGSSAIRIIWDDSHAAGIYSYAMLRDLAPPADIRY